MDVKQQNTNNGITSLSIKGKTLNLTFAGKEVRIVLDGDSSIEWVGGVRYSCDCSPEIITRVAPIKYLPVHFAEVNQLVIEQHYLQEAAIRDVAEKYGFIFENFRRQYYNRDGNKYYQDRLE